jgi:hypothetical protein
MYALLASLATKSPSLITARWHNHSRLYIVYILIIFYFTLVNWVLSTQLTYNLGNSSFTNFHPMVSLVDSWLIYYSIKTKMVYLAILVTFCWFLIWISFDPSQHLGMFIFQRDIFSPTTFNPISGSTIVLVARAGLIAVLIHGLKWQQLSQ